MELTAPRLYCDDLVTAPLPGRPRILVTGASGYVGGRLVPELLARGYRVRALFRDPRAPYPRSWKGVEVAHADCAVPHQIRAALRGIHAAFYLVHSLAVGREDFETPDLLAASTFRAAAAECGVRRIVYLGALRPQAGRESVHLRSRLRVHEVLAEGSVPLTTLRAGIIVGSGSASFEMIRSMVARHRILPVVRAFRHRCQPIAVRDVLKYLVGALEAPATTGLSFDIGGPEVLTYRDMLEQCAAILGRRVRIVFVPDLWPGFVAWRLAAATPVPRRIAAALLASLQCDVVCREQEIRRHLDFRLIPFGEAVQRALRREACDDVPTRWADASLGIAWGERLVGALSDPRLRRLEASRRLDVAPEQVFPRLKRIGGGAGWHHANWAWRLRGAMDRLLGGVGLERGRRSRKELEPGDTVDFWRVEELVEGRRLLLRSQMRTPGAAWLEFLLDPEGGDRTRLRVTAFFRPRSVWGQLYWVLLLPVHLYVFRGMLRRLARETLPERA